VSGPSNRRAASADVGPAVRRTLHTLKAEIAARMWPEIADPTDAQRAAMPHAIDCERPTAEDLRQAFAAELHARKRWCREHCAGVFCVKPIHRLTLGPDVGRRFRFSDQTDAAFFRLAFC
jgi:hypothetical protein